MKAIQVSARVDQSVKKSAQKVFKRQGLDMARPLLKCLSLRQLMNSKLHYQFKRIINKPILMAGLVISTLLIVMRFHAWHSRNHQFKI